MSLAASTPSTSSAAQALRPRIDMRLVLACVLLLPAVAFFVVFFVIPVGMMIGFSFFQQLPNGGVTSDFTLANYARLATVELYRTVLWTTLRVSALTTLFCMIAAYPVALVMVRGRPWWGHVLTVVVIAPLLVNVVIRTYGWRVILANSNTGVLNWALKSLGLVDAPVRLLFTEWAIVIGSVHVFFPLMVLPIASALGKIDPSVEEAARTLGGSSLAVFRRVTLPLSIPGLAVGSTLVFSLTASSFVAPALLGGNFAKMLGTLVEEQIMSVFDWPFGAAIATVLVALIMAINFVYLRAVGRKYPDRAVGAGA